MGQIHVRDIVIHSNHGCMEEEELIGSEYVVHVSVDADLTLSTRTDKLSDTIDYVSIYGIVKEEMEKRSKLLEVVVERILQRIMREHLEVDKAEVEVQKINPPIGGNVGYVSVKRSKKRKEN